MYIYTYKHTLSHTYTHTQYSKLQSYSTSSLTSQQSRSWRQIQAAYRTSPQTRLATAPIRSAARTGRALSLSSSRIPGFKWCRKYDIKRVLLHRLRPLTAQVVRLLVTFVKSMEREQGDRTRDVGQGQRGEREEQRELARY